MQTVFLFCFLYCEQIKRLENNIKIEKNADLKIHFRDSKVKIALNKQIQHFILLNCFNINRRCRGVNDNNNNRLVGSDRYCQSQISHQLYSTTMWYYLRSLSPLLRPETIIKLVNFGYIKIPYILLYLILQFQLSELAFGNPNHS